MPRGGRPSTCATVRRGGQNGPDKMAGGAAEATVVAAPTLKREAPDGPRRRWGSVRSPLEGVQQAGEEDRGDSAAQSEDGDDSGGEEERGATAQPAGSMGERSESSGVESAAAESDGASEWDRESVGSWGSQDARRFRESLAPSTSDAGPGREVSPALSAEAGSSGTEEEEFSAEDSAEEGPKEEEEEEPAPAAAAAAAPRPGLAAGGKEGAGGSGGGDHWVARMPVCDALRRAWSAAHSGPESPQGRA